MSDTLFDVADLDTPRTEPNPCRRLYGPGPAGKRCSTCSLLARNGQGHKCTLRKFTRGAGSDHMRRWQRVGKRAAGRLLYGREHNEFPAGLCST